MALLLVLELDQDTQVEEQTIMYIQVYFILTF